MITIHVCLQRLGHSQQPAQKFLVLNLLVYIYDAQGNIFKPLPDMPWDLPRQILDANEALQRISAGHPLLMLCHAVTQNAILVSDICQMFHDRCHGHTVTRHLQCLVCISALGMPNSAQQGV